MIALSVPGRLEYRDVAVRVVGAACKLFSRGSSDSQPPAAEGAAKNELADELTSQVVSAFSEAFNNLAIHGYKGLAGGRIDIRVELLGGADGDAIAVELSDSGHVFDPSSHTDLPDELPERGMGLFIIRSFMDEVEYRPGPPNVLRLVKRLPR